MNLECTTAFVWTYVIYLIIERWTRYAIQEEELQMKTECIIFQLYLAACFMFVY